MVRNLVDMGLHLENLVHGITESTFVHGVSSVPYGMYQGTVYVCSSVGADMGGRVGGRFPTMKSVGQTEIKLRLPASGQT